MAGEHIAVQAAIEKKRQRREEEEMTGYTRDELSDDYEFKIVRSNTSAFKKYEMVERIKAEEAAAGWMMVEKFDDNRLRFKRPFSAQQKDASLLPGIDPYRTTIGLSEAGLAFTIIGTLAVAGGLVFLLVQLLG